MMFFFSSFMNVVALTSANKLCTTEPNFFGLVPWYHYLNVDASCHITEDFTLLDKVVGGKTVQSDLPLILFAILDDLLRIAGIVAVGFVIYGAIQYVVSQGEPDKTTKARMTILNSLIGLAIALVAVGAVSYIGHKLGTS